MRLFIVEPYYGGSHRAWVDGYAAHSAHDVTVVTHDARFWKWRMQGAHVTLANDIGRIVQDGGAPDIVVASSMTDLAGLLGLTRRTVGRAAVALFVHETQLAYPLSPLDKEDATYPMLNWTAMNAADLVLFNSAWHRDRWLADLPGFLRRLPDHRHDGLIDAVTDKIEVMPVGVELARFNRRPPAEDDGPPVVLWNHRWEHDKRPDLFVSAIGQVADSGRDFRLALAGERFARSPRQPVPAELAALRTRFADRIVFDSDAIGDVYTDVLVGADVVVSTAEQENFGISVTEAVYAGAFPLLPNRLVYPERIPLELHDVCLYEDGDDLVRRLIAVIDDADLRAATARRLRPVMATLDWSLVAPRYDTRFAALAESARTT